MDKDVLIFKKGPENLIGDILDQEFTIDSENMGKVTRRQQDIAWLIFDLYADENAPDQMMLHKTDQFVGKILNKSVRIRVDGEERDIPTSKIRSIMFDSSSL